jgi:DNA polymerase-3 subunit delta'
LRRGLNERESALSQEIRVGEVRKMRSFFTLSAADGGRRVAIVDSVDEMAPEGANALLKTLEEPPKGAVLILVSHQPARLLPTIRSRCRSLRLSPLAPADLAAALAQAGATVAPGREAALAELAQGSAGAAFRLAALDGLELYAAIVALFANLPRLDRPAMIRLADVGAARGAEAQFDLIVGLIDLFLARLALSATRAAPLPEAATGEAALFARLAPDAGAARDWAALAQGLGQKARRGKAVNLDPFALLVDMVLRIEETAATLASRS